MNSCIAVLPVIPAHTSRPVGAATRHLPIILRPNAATSPQTACQTFAFTRPPSLILATPPSSFQAKTGISIVEAHLIFRRPRCSHCLSEQDPCRRRVTAEPITESLHSCPYWLGPASRQTKRVLRLSSTKLTCSSAKATSGNAASISPRRAVPTRSTAFLDNLALTEYKRRVGQLTKEAANGQE